MLTYNNSISTSDGLILSVDNIVADFRIKDPRAKEGLFALLNEIEYTGAAIVKNWSKYSIGTFHDQFGIQLPDGSAFWIGYALNQEKTDWSRVRLDANPNKVGDSPVFQRLLNYLVINSIPDDRCVKRFDLAIDIPTSRNNVMLIKDARLYREYRHGENRTQYLGKKSKVGYVKLYNKTKESKLSYPLTRLEVTLSPQDPYRKVRWPKVYVIHEHQMTLDDYKITDTERFIVDALLHGFGSLTTLGRKARAKISKLISEYVCYVTILPKDYERILDQVRKYIKA